MSDIQRHRVKFALMLLDLTAHPEYYSYYDWLRPSARRGANDEVARLYKKIWKPGREYDDTSFKAFDEVRISIIPTVTNGFRENPTRAEMLAALARVRGNQFDPENKLELAMAAMLESRDARWEALAGHLKAQVPQSFVLYRYVHGLGFCQDVAHAFKTSSGNPRFLRLRHDEISSWSLTRDGAMCMRTQERRPGVLFKAILPFNQTVADILVDDSTFQRAYHRQAEVVVLANPNTIQCVPDAVEVYLGSQQYSQQTWAQMAAYLKSIGRAA